MPRFICYYTHTQRGKYTLDAGDPNTAKLKIAQLTPKELQNTMEYWTTEATSICEAEDECSVKILGNMYKLKKAPAALRCDWFLPIDRHVIMAWSVSSTAGGRAWNFTSEEYEKAAYQACGCRLPQEIASSQGDLIILIRPKDDAGEDYE